MEDIRRTYRSILIGILIIMGILIGLIYFYTTNKLLHTYQDYAGESIKDVKKIFLKDTIDNVILEIKLRQDKRVEYYKHILNDITNTLDLYYKNSSSENFVEDVIEYLQNDSDYNRIKIKITEKNTGIVIYENFDTSITGVPGEIIEENYPVYLSRGYGKYALILSVNKSVIDEDVKTEMYDVIHNYKFSENAYIWVNEVINYEGGDNYAIRRIHPNLQDTEGMYLSTEMTDIEGNHPYLTELEGVKQDGEIFFNYYFQKKDSQVISEKITYAKLYEEYDWIIAKGIHLDDIEAYVQKTANQSRQNLKDMLSITALIMILLILVILIFISHLEKWYYKNSNRELKEQVYLDPLTGLFNRRAAEIYLEDVFNRYRHMGQNSAVMMIDVDNFKSINDSYGHDKGDYVLIQIANTLTKYIRSTDILCRWGGEEFILICLGMQNDRIHPFTWKLLNSIYGLNNEFKENGIKSNITISIGATIFLESDFASGSAVNRADKALYKAKNQGKNQAVIYEEIFELVQ